MKIKWNGHASFTIRAIDGVVIITDPYDPGGYGGALAYEPVSDQADIVLVSHEHADHNFVEGLPGAPKVLKGSGQVMGVNVKGIQMYHDESGGSQRGENMVFVFALEGLNICFTGDLGHRLSQDQLKAIGPVDLLFVPVGGTFTLDAQSAVDVVNAVHPKVVIPMHYKTDKCGLPIATADGFLAKMTNVKKTGQSEVELSQADLPETGTEVWILDYAC
ncbi:MAG: MBL fold metallo-hydrolase [Deltaproteobacteria bacterium]|nr:MBL fold metallo-hydrolase [Deltaproteobacteria bacterium]